MHTGVNKVSILVIPAADHKLAVVHYKLWCLFTLWIKYKASFELRIKMIPNSASKVRSTTTYIYIFSIQTWKTTYIWIILLWLLVWKSEDRIFQPLKPLPHPYAPISTQTEVINRKPGLTKAPRYEINWLANCATKFPTSGIIFRLSTLAYALQRTIFTVYYHVHVQSRKF